MYHQIFLRKQVVWSLVLAFQDDVLPFPWPRSKNHMLQSSSRSASPGPMLGEKGSGCQSSGCAAGMANPLAMESTTTESCSSSSGDTTSDHDTIDSSEFLEYRLPRKGVPAGKVLQHAKSVFANLHRKHQPMVYKFGYTHDPTWRWSNPIYGYKFDRQKWSHMVVLFESTEPFGPAMLEACLIDLYQCYLITT